VSVVAVQAADTALPTEQVAHEEQEDEPVSALNVPLSQSWHALTPPTEYLPTWHSVQVWSAMLARFPTPQ
jgi:hypothetical protein